MVFLSQLLLPLAWTGFFEIQTHSNFKTSSLPCCLLLVGFNWEWFYTLVVFSGLCQERRIFCDDNSTFLSVFSHVKIFLKLQQHQAQVRQHVGHEHENSGGIPLNIERCKKIVCTIAWVLLALVFRYFPIFIYLILATATNWLGSIFYVSALTVVYFNSTLNPILFCWKICESS